MFYHNIQFRVHIVVVFAVVEVIVVVHIDILYNDAMVR